jgi:hypothetical protein
MPETVRKLLVLTAFAVAMALVEAAIVVYLRHLYYPEDPLRIFPLRLLSDADLVLEWARELATVVMILSVAWLTEKGLLRSFAAFVFVFGLWDIFYYAWLKLLLGWPAEWLEWDVLYLIPWPWFGPWLAPTFIALLFVLWGAWVLLSERHYGFTPLAIILFFVGVVLALVTFLHPGLTLLALGREGFRGYVPNDYSWGLFMTGWVLMATGLWQSLREA